MANRDLTTQGASRGVSAYGRDPFSLFRREMDRLFEDFFTPLEGRSFGAPAAGQAAPSGQMMGSVWPSLDVDESPGAYTVTAELPGLEQKDVELNLQDNVLTLSGEKRQERKEGDGGRAYVERMYGRFERTIPFPTEIDPDKVEASFRNGVLKITLPKNAQAQERSRRIEIKPEPPEQAAEAGPPSTH